MGMGVSEVWLGDRDSNPDTMVQSHVCCHYTIPQRGEVFIIENSPSRRQEVAGTGALEQGGLSELGLSRERRPRTSAAQNVQFGHGFLILTPCGFVVGIRIAGAEQGLGFCFLLFGLPNVQFLFRECLVGQDGH